MKRRNLVAALLGAVAAAWLFNTAAFTQSTERPKTGRAKLLPPVAPQLPTTTGEENLPIPALEYAVDPAEYVTGPGDRFIVVIPAYDQVGIPASIMADGRLLIPTLGTFQAAGKTLAQLQQEILERGKKRYRQGSVQVFLAEPRVFRVHVLGEVRKPGIYPIRQTYRVSDALELAEGANDWANLSAIEIRRKNSETLTVDLLQYTTAGELEQNPRLLDGDVVFVPRIDQKMPIVRVVGNFDKAGLYYARPNETAAEFLYRITGASRKSDILSAAIRRPLGDEDRYAVIPIFPGKEEQLADGDAEKFILRDGDIVSIPSISDSVYVMGAVYLPGPYPYFPGFRARDYAGLAGPTEHASGPGGIRVRHADTGRTEGGPDAPVRPGDTVEVVTAKRIILRDYLQIAATVLGQVFTFLTVRAALRR